MSVREKEKAVRYLAQLDSARCNGQWHDVPELARKVEKHAPHRKTLALTARSEAQVATYTHPDRPPTSASESTRSPLSKLIPPLLEIIDGGGPPYPEDTFQATVCLAWLHWVLREPGLAASRLPRTIAQSLYELTTTPTDSPQWIQVCGVKGAYIRGFGLEKINNLDAALTTYTSMLPYLSSIPSLGSMSPEFRVWCERLLTRTIALTMSQPPGQLLDLDKILQVFHLWTSLFQISPLGQKGPVRAPPMVQLGSEVLYSRWDVWMDYYKTLSYILKRGFVYSPSYSETIPLVVTSRFGISDDEYLKARLRQRAELKRVEACMETKLLEETRFPKANERNERVERWVDAVMQNWRIMCGPTWQDAELGEGGKNALARGVLDILYRAATKTFHSTQILRHLFTVHAYVAEFDLAFQAFDTYEELVSRGKAKAAKNSIADGGFDSSEDTILTAAEAITLLCRFGARHEAEQARDIAKKLEQWIIEEEERLNEYSASHGYTSRSEPMVSGRALSIAYHALAKSEANWSRWTYDAAARSEIRDKAIQLVRQALDSRWANGDDLEILFTFALLLAESRDIPGAVRVVKAALAQQPPHSDNGVRHADGLSATTTVVDSPLDFAHERRLVPFWHLLGLLLTARADLENGTKACDAAFEQFQAPTNLFGPEVLRLDRVQFTETEKSEQASGIPLVDRMGRFEKESLVQIKVTQIALIEELEGPSTAVDLSPELLALYARLFGDPRSDTNRPRDDQPSKPPKTAKHSIRASLLGRGRSRKQEDKPFSTTNLTHRSSTRGTATTATTKAPTIQVTDEEGSARPQTNGHHGPPPLFRPWSRRPGSVPTTSRSGSVKLRKRSTSVRSSIRRRSGESARPDSTLTANDPIPITDPMSGGNGTIGRDFASGTTAGPRPSTATNSVVGASPRGSMGPDQPLRDIPHNMPRDKLPPPPEHDDQPPKQDIRLPAPHPATKEATPEPRFPVMQERRHKVTLLVEIWTFIAGLYTRGGLFDDAKGAIDEAADLVRTLENDVAAISSSAKAFTEKGWGGGKPVEELWGDVWAQRGDLSQASSTAFEAIAEYEKALAHSPDHAAAIIGLSTILLKIYDQTIPAEPTELSVLLPCSREATSGAADRDNACPTSPPATGPSSSRSLSNPAPSASHAASPRPAKTAKETSTHDERTSPEALNRLAARDRAYHLLSTLTKLAQGWDNSEAWSALAKAHEACGQIDKAKEALWWVVECEDTRPIRPWRVVGLAGGGFAL